MRSTILLLLYRMLDAAGEGMLHIHLFVARSCVITCMHVFIYGPHGLRNSTGALAPLQGIPGVPLGSEGEWGLELGP